MSHCSLEEGIVLWNLRLNITQSIIVASISCAISIHFDVARGDVFGGLTLLKLADCERS